VTESTRSCTPDLCIDDAPATDGSSGSGGWGWDNTTSAPVTTLAIGTTAPFVATVLQPGGVTANGSVTLTWNPYDFTLDTTSLPGDGACAGQNSNTESCSFTDLSHSAKSIPFSFTPDHANPAAVVTVTADVGGEQASAQFPVAIAAAG
jgi:hypothetical protein